MKTNRLLVVALILLMLFGWVAGFSQTNSFPASGNAGIGTTAPSSYFHGGNNRLLEIANPNTDVNSQSHVVLSTGSTTGNSSAGTLTWVSSNSAVNKALGYIGMQSAGDLATHAAGEIRFATSDGGGAVVRMVLDKFGNLALGIANPSARLAVNGKVLATEVQVAAATNWPNYVFAADYQVMSLAELKAFIKKNGHLPEVPDAATVAEQGIQLGEMNKILLKKIEELTLHLIKKMRNCLN